MADSIIFFSALHFVVQLKHTHTRIELENMAQASLYDCKIYIKEPLPFCLIIWHTIRSQQPTSLGFVAVCVVNTPNQEFR